jgi:HEPN domain-containing protein
MNVDNGSRARAWLSNAAGDLRAVTVLMDALPHLACFHAQQAADKALKAVITLRNGEAPRTPDSRELLEVCASVGDAAPDGVRAGALSLERFYMSTRYPDALGWADAAVAFTRRDAEGARDDATAVVAWADARLGSENAGGDRRSE